MWSRLAVPAWTFAGFLAGVGVEAVANLFGTTGAAITLSLAFGFACAAILLQNPPHRYRIIYWLVLPIIVGTSGYGLNYFLGWLKPISDQRPCQVLNEVTLFGESIHLPREFLKSERFFYAINDIKSTRAALPYGKDIIVKVKKRLQPVAVQVRFKRGMVGNPRDIDLILSGQNEQGVVSHLEKCVWQDRISVGFVNYWEPDYPPLVIRIYTAEPIDIESVEEANYKFGS